MHRLPNFHTIGTPLPARRASESSAMIHALAFVYQGELVYAHIRRKAFTPARKQYRIGLLFTGITKVTSARVMLSLVLTCRRPTTKSLQVPPGIRTVRIKEQNSQAASRLSKSLPLATKLTQVDRCIKSFKFFKTEYK